MRNTTKLIWCLGLAAALCGCSTVRESVPPRTATEQLLLSTAAARSLGDRDFSWLAGKKVFVEDKYFESYDKGFAEGVIRERLSARGALLVKSDDKAEVIVEIRSGVLSMDNVETFVGIPAMALPIPLTGPVQTPELALYKRQRADALAKFILFAYERVSGQYLRSVGPMSGRSHQCFYKVLFVSWQKSDVPELPLRKKPKATKAPTPSAPPGS